MAKVLPETEGSLSEMGSLRRREPSFQNFDFDYKLFLLRNAKLTATSPYAGTLTIRVFKVCEGYAEVKMIETKHKLTVSFIVFTLTCLLTVVISTPN